MVHHTIIMITGVLYARQFNNYLLLSVFILFAISCATLQFCNGKKWNAYSQFINTWLISISTFEQCQRRSAISSRNFIALVSPLSSISVVSRLDLSQPILFCSRGDSYYRKLWLIGDLQIIVMIMHHVTTCAGSDKITYQNSSFSAVSPQHRFWTERYERNKRFTC